MAYPVFYPFKTRMYQATTTSSAATVNCVVGARGKYLGGYVSAGSSSILSVVADVLLNGTGITGSTGTSITSSTSPLMGGGVAIPAPTVSTFVNAGDVLGTLVSTALGGYSVTHIVQEF